MIFLFYLLLAAACSTQITPDEATPTLDFDLTLYQTATPRRSTPTLAETTVVTSTAIPTPSPTPFTYNIVKDDTLLGIALKHGLTLDELLAANPGIDPNFLTIGMTITLPINGAENSALPTATPIPLIIHPVNCYPGGDQGQWCLASVENTQSVAVENVSAEMVLNVGEKTHSQTVYLPVNLLKSGQSAPLMAYFPVPHSENSRVQVTQVAALPALDHEQRYLNTTIQVSKQIIDSGGKSATIAGKITNNSSSEANSLLLILVAYDNAELPVGVRKFEIELDSELPPDEQYAFENTVYSLGPTIERVDVFAELKP